MTLDQLLQALSEPKNFSQRINALYQQAINEAAKELPPQQTPSAAQISPHFEHIISEQLLYGLQFKNEALYPVVVDNKPEVPQAGHYFIAKHNSALQYATEEKDKTISRVTLDQDPQDIRILQGNNKTITLNQAEATNFIIKKTGHALELLQLIEQINNLDLDTEVKKILVNSLTLHHHQQEINLSTTYITPDEKLATKKAYLHELHKTLNNPDQTEVVKAINARKALNTSLIVTPGNLNTVLLNIDTDPDNTIHPRQRERIELGGLLGAFCTDTEFKALRKSERVLYDALIFDSKVSEALQKKLNLEVITLQTRNESDPEIGSVLSASLCDRSHEIL